MKRLIFIDVDGTLHGKDGVPPCAWQAIENARSLGVRFSLATGRPNAGVSLEYARKVDAESLHAFHQGALVTDSAGRPIHGAAFPELLYHQLVDLAHLYALPLEAYGAEGQIRVGRVSIDIDRHSRLLAAPISFAELHWFWRQQQIVRTQWVVRRSPLWGRAKSRVDGIIYDELEWHIGTSPATPGVIYASLLSKGAGKLQAASWIASAMGVSLQDCAMIGDGDNDVELIARAGIGVAMGNATEKAKRAADYLAPDIEECGLAAAIDYVTSNNVK